MSTWNAIGISSEGVSDYVWGTLENIKQLLFPRRLKHCSILLLATIYSSFIHFILICLKIQSLFENWIMVENRMDNERLKTCRWITLFTVKRNRLICYLSFDFILFHLSLSILQCNCVEITVAVALDAKLMCCAILSKSLTCSLRLLMCPLI